MKTRILLSALLAGSVISMPVSAEAAKKRKTLFEVLFKKAHERKQKKKQRLKVLRQQQLQRQQASVPKKKIKKKKVAKLAKVATSKNYAYRVAKRAPIVLVAAPVSFALANTGSDTAQSEKVTISPLTADIVSAGEMNMRAEAHLAEAVADFYKTNQSYYWLNEVGDYNARAKSALKVLSEADRYGLRPNDYKVDASVLAYDLYGKALSREKISREVALTTAVLRYAMDAKFGTCWMLWRVVFFNTRFNLFTHQMRSLML